MSDEIKSSHIISGHLRSPTSHPIPLHPYTRTSYLHEEIENQLQKGTDREIERGTHREMDLKFGEHVVLGRYEAAKLQNLSAQPQNPTSSSPEPLQPNPIAHCRSL